MSHQPSLYRRGRKPKPASASGVAFSPPKKRQERQERSSKARLNELNPYSLDANGWCDPTSARGQAYDRAGPPADPRAALASGEGARLDAWVAELKQQAPAKVNVEKLFGAWATHPRRDAVRPLFPVLDDDQLRAELVRIVGEVRVRGTEGSAVALGEKIRESKALTDLEANRILCVLAELRHAWLTRDADAGYDEINWRHACAEVGAILDIAEAHELEPLVTEDAVLASLFSDAAKLKGNFLTHHVDGAVAAALVLPRMLNTKTAGGRARIVTICQAILEHQVGPPRFMAAMVKQGIVAQAQGGASSSALASLQRKIADPMNPQHVRLHEDGYGVLVVDDAERALLSRIGLPDWYVPHPSTPWYVASTAVIDADSLVNYVTPDGVGKIVAICGPGTPFHDPTVFHSIFSCGASFVDAVSVMSDVAMGAVKSGVNHTRTVIDDVRARVSVEIDEGWLHFTKDGFRRVIDEEQVDVSQLHVRDVDGEVLVDVPWADGGALPFWNAPLDYDRPGAAFEHAKLLRRKVADLLRVDG